MSEYTVNDLKDMAREIPIKGFSRMKKAELIKALKAEGYLPSPKKRSPSPKKKSPSPKKVMSEVRKDFNKMVKPDIIKLIKQLDPSYKLKSNLKKAELIDIVEYLVSKAAVPPVAPADVPVPAPVVVPSPIPAMNYEKMTVVQLKDIALLTRGLKIGAMKKSDIINILKGEVCDPEIGSYCSNPSDFCDIRFKSCVGKFEEKLEQITINGHNVVGTKKSLEELRRKLGTEEITKKVSPKKVSPKKVSPLSDAPIEDVLSEIARPPVSTQEFRQNLQRLKICLGLMSR
jgi:hypothetical protein